MTTNKWVKLNVGGQLFNTTRDTLQFEPSSMLAKMFEPSSGFLSSQLDENGAFLIDRDPQYFRVILNYLRTGNLVVDEGVSLDGLLAEAEFYQLAPLIELLAPHNRPDMARRDLLDTLNNAAAANPPPKYSRLRLNNIDLCGLDLSCLNFTKSGLRAARFCHSNLRQAVFARTTGDHVDFTGANLSSAVFKLAYLHGSMFGGVWATNTNFSAANLSGSDFSGAMLKGALFQKACLRGCSFRGANLEHAKLQEADLRDTDFTGAMLDEAHITDADCRGAVIDLIPKQPSTSTTTVTAQAPPLPAPIQPQQQPGGGVTVAAGVRIYTKGAVLNAVDQAALPEALRRQLEVVTLTGLSETHAMRKKITDDVSRCTCLVYVKGLQQDVLPDRYQRRLFTLLDSLHVPYICKNAFDEQFDSGLAQFTTQPFLPKVFINGRFIEVFSERAAIRASKRELLSIIEAALANERTIPDPVPIEIPRTRSASRASFSTHHAHTHRITTTAAAAASPPTQDMTTQTTTPTVPPPPPPTAPPTATATNEQAK